MRTSELDNFLENTYGVAISATPQEIKKILSEHQPGPIQLISFEELWGDHRINAKKALRLGIEGKIRFFVPVEKATIVWEEVIVSGDGEEFFDPQCILDVDKAIYFQVAPQSLSEIFRSGETSHIRLSFPESLKNKIGAWKPGAEYRSRIERNFLVCLVPLWPELSRNPENPAETPARKRLEDLKKQRARTIGGLFILNEDVAAHEEERAECNESLVSNLAKQQPTAGQGALVKEPTADGFKWGWQIPPPTKESE